MNDLPAPPLTICYVDSWLCCCCCCCCQYYYWSIGFVLCVAFQPLALVVFVVTKTKENKHTPTEDDDHSFAHTYVPPYEENGSQQTDTRRIQNHFFLLIEWMKNIRNKIFLFSFLYIFFLCYLFICYTHAASYAIAYDECRFKIDIKRANKETICIFLLN